MNVQTIANDVPARPVLLTARDFDVLVRAGALERVARADLRDGTICEMTPQYSDHGFAKDELGFAIRLALRGSDLSVFSETSLWLDDYNMPAPDLSICAPFVRGGAIPLEAVRLLVEVAVNTLADDLGRKRSLYAGAGVPEYWVVDVAARAIHVFATPDTGCGVYRDARVVQFGQPLTAVTVPGLIVATEMLA